jgi:hypothetical protein
MRNLHSIIANLKFTPSLLRVSVTPWLVPSPYGTLAFLGLFYNREHNSPTVILT